jgi:HPt (histidine-containing phosphotransfer) domain-containing protein
MDVSRCSRTPRIRQSEPSAGEIRPILLTMSSTPGPNSRDLSGDPAVAELVAFFLGELERRVPRMQKAWDQGDLEELARHAHDLRGSAASFGFPDITSCARTVEDGIAREADVSEVRERIEEMLLICRRACISRSGDT